MAGQDAKTPRRVGVREFRANLTDFLRQARSGDAFLVTVRGEILAEIGPPREPDPVRRRPGALRGRIRLAPDFDALPPDLIAAMEGDGG